MPVEVGLLSALLVGLLGGVHCIGMCGGIVGALTLGVCRDGAATLPFHLAYNAGRVVSYTAAGALVGGIGQLAGHLADLRQVQLVLLVGAGLFMVAMGLYLAGWWLGLAQVERLGGALWRRIEPFGRRLLPVTAPSRAFALGLLWGWLPCGLVYSVLIWAVAAGSPLKGAGYLLAFGIGTLPNLLAMGFAASRLGAFLREPAVRAAAGATVILFGLYTLLLAGRGLG